MANQQHLDLLKQGVDAWNQWRRKHPDMQPDLAEASLRETNLTLADLRYANLNAADLAGSDLSSADLSYAQLKKASLYGTSFYKASFTGADFSEALFGKVNLSGAMLSGINLSGAYLDAANLYAAQLSDAQLNGSDLSGATLSGAMLNKADLRGAKLKNANLYGTDLTGANLSSALLTRANFYKAQLRGANLSRAFLNEVDLSEANLSEANLSEALLHRANLYRTDLSSANLSSADLSRAILVKTRLTKAILTNCLIYGIAAWDVQLEESIQFNLRITLSDQPTITVDNLKVAQFIYLLLNNNEIREVIDTITSKVVLILGRFTPERKAVLDAFRDELRKQNYSPVLFDFEKPVSRDLTETVSTLAHLARFIIVDLTDPSSAPHEVATVIPQTVVPVQPLLSQESIMVDGRVVERHEYAMFEDLRRRYHWVLPTLRYRDTAELLASFRTRVIIPAEQKAIELTQPK